MRLEKFTSQNYPLAVKSTRKTLLAKDLIQSEFNKMRFLSRKKFVVSNERKDATSEHVTVSVDEPKKDPIVRERPLRGYLKQGDYDQIQSTNDFLYAEYDLDRIEREARSALNKPTPKQYIGPYQPSKKEIDNLFNNCRKYQGFIKKVKKDVTYTEA